MSTNPYRELPARAFWRPAVAEPDPRSIAEVWTPKFALDADEPILTAGSCFAARIGPALLDFGMNWFDAEPAPPGLSADQRRARHYGEFSFRTGNIYTAIVLKQWISWAVGASPAPADAWEHEGRFFDPYRPSVEPEGYASAAEMLEDRDQTLAAIRRGIARAGCLFFTLGLTESWGDRATETVYPACPGTVRGEFDPERHVFRNHAFEEVRRDLLEALTLARTANPGLRLLLTVSPVPLTATASGQHVLTANSHSKSLLRAVAGQLAQEHADVDYFPSYELITGAPFRSRFYTDNLREVTPEGVDFVMGHFRSAHIGHAAPAQADPVCQATLTRGGDVCDDAVLDYYAPR